MAASSSGRMIVPVGFAGLATTTPFRSGMSANCSSVGWNRVSGPLASLRLMRACYPYLKGDGVVINLGTAASLRQDLGGYGAYAAVKEATRSLTRAAACEWGMDGIRVNCIIPLAMSKAMEGWIAARPEESAAFLATVPMRRAGDCEADIGRAVAQICGPAFGFVTGQTIALDGGQAFLR